MLSTHFAPSINKTFRSSFNMILANHPVAARIANTVLFGELLTDGAVLVFGDYDLVLCYQEDGSEDVYHTEVINRVFAETIPLKRSVSSSYAQALPVQVYVSSPLQARIRAVKPSKFKFWDLVKSMIYDLTWVEVQVEGKITVEVALPQEAVPARRLDAQSQDGDSCEQGDSLPEDKETEAVKKDEEITISLDALADLALQIIQRHEAESAQEIIQYDETERAKEAVSQEASQGDQKTVANQTSIAVPLSDTSKENQGSASTAVSHAAKSDGLIPPEIMKYYEKLGFDEKTMQVLLASRPIGGIPNKPPVKTAGVGAPKKLS